MLEFFRALIAKEPARVVAYSSAVAVALALKVAELAGVTLSAEILAGVSALAALIVTELLRRFVFSPAATQRIANRAARTGNTNIGDPPAGPAG